MSDLKDAKLSEQETVEIQLNDGSTVTSRKSSTSTSSFEEREITDIRPLDQQPASVTPTSETRLPRKTPRGVALTFKTTSHDDPAYYSQSSLGSDKIPKTGRAGVHVRAQEKMTSEKIRDIDRDPDRVNEDIKVGYLKGTLTVENKHFFFIRHKQSYNIL